MLTGSMVALVTPMTAQGSVDYGVLDELIEKHSHYGTQGLVILGSTGEAATLTKEEQQQMVAYIVQKVANRMTVVAGTYATSTWQAIQNTQWAQEAGAHACLIMAPAYIKPTQAGLYEHYKAIAEAVAIPILLYNVPGRTACDLSAETVIKLAKIPNIVGIKESCGDVGRAIEIMRMTGPDFIVLSGDDALTLPMMLSGGKGVISVTANVAPKLMRQLCDAIFIGDISRAIAINHQLVPLHKLLFVEANPIPVKWCLHKMGWIDEGIRLPLTQLSSAFHAQLTEALTQLGLI